jgi:hypothetical protein
MLVMKYVINGKKSMDLNHRKMKKVIRVCKSTFLHNITHKGIHYKDKKKRALRDKFSWPHAGVAWLATQQPNAITASVMGDSSGLSSLDKNRG